LPEKPVPTAIRSKRALERHRTANLADREAGGLVLQAAFAADTLAARNSDPAKVPMRIPLDCTVDWTSRDRVLAGRFPANWSAN
jgi:hypothetical protein